MSKKNHHHTVEQAHTLLGDDAVAKAGEVREHLNEAVTAAKETYSAVKKTGIKRVQATDHAIRDNPYRALGIAFGLGALLGFMLCRRGGEES